MVVTQWADTISMLERDNKGPWSLRTPAPKLGQKPDPGSGVTFKIKLLSVDTIL